MPLECVGYLTCLALFVTACSSSPGAAPGAACSDGQALQVGFYAFFAPVSYSADADPGTAGFDEHRGYEADLLTAVAADGRRGPVLCPPRHVPSGPVYG